MHRDDCKSQGRAAKRCKQQDRNRIRLREQCTHIRKPIYVWSDTEVFWKDFDNKGGMYSFLDWEFIEYLGLGIELNRHVAILWQPLLYSIRTNAYKASNPYDNGLDTWRLGMEFTW